MHYHILRNILCSIFTLFFFYGSAQTKKEWDSIFNEGIKASGKREYAKAMDLYIKAHDIAERKNWPDHLFTAKNNIGVTYYTMLDYGEALKYYSDAYQIAIKNHSKNNEMTAIGNIASLYNKERNYDKAYDFLKKALAISLENNDKATTALWYINLANNANKRQKPDEAVRYVKLAFETTNDPGTVNLGKMLLAESDMMRGDVTLARKKAQELYPTIADLAENNIGTSLLLIIAKSYLYEKDFPNAEKSINVILQQRPDAETKREAQSILVMIYQEQGLYKDALRYKDSLLKTERELNDLKNGRLYETNKFKFEIENYKKDMGYKEEKLNDQRRLLYAVILIIIAAFVITILLLRTRFIKNSKQKALAERNEKIIALELEKQKSNSLLLEQEIKEKEANALLEQEKLRNEIESRNRELSSKEFYISGRNQLIKDILETLTQNPKLKKDPAIESHIKTLKNHLLDSNDLQNFITHFEQVNQGLLKKLQALHPLLTANDIRFIAYVYMNLSNKEIATILNITPLACSKRKERIIAKLELPKNIPLYTYLSGI